MVDISDIMAHSRKDIFEQFSPYTVPLESHLVDHSKPDSEQVEAASRSQNQILKNFQQYLKIIAQII